MQSLRKDTGQLARNLGLLAALVAGSVLLFAFQSWLQASGGWALLVTGLVCLWSALLAVLAAVQEHRRIQREQAIDAALAEIRRVLGTSAPHDDEERL
jgi:predicted tellurium resistance membrane protein TerC